MKKTRILVGVFTFFTIMVFFGGGPAAAWFQDNGNGTVTDSETGLVWEQVEGENGSGAVSWEDGLAYCEDLDRGGMSDWRLPGIRELESLVDENRYDPAADGVFGYGSLNTWSSTTYSLSPTQVWYVGFESGTVSYGNKDTAGLYARCVRGGPAGTPPPKQFRENGNDTVTDTRTGLVWEQVKGGNGSEAVTWQAALSYCENLGKGGINNWRLPSIRELESLVDEERYNAAVDGVFGYGSLNAWSSTSYSTSSTQAWYVGFESGKVSYGDKDGSSYYARCVCGGSGGSFNNLVIDQSPRSSATSMLFILSGKGFTDNSTATLHFQKPDGTVDLPQQEVPVNDYGQFSFWLVSSLDEPAGEYTWWAVDGPTGRVSKDLHYTIDPNKTITTGNYNVTNSGKISNEFELWLDISINNEKPGSGFKNQYEIEIKNVTDSAPGVSIAVGECEHHGDGNTPNSSRYRQFFKIDANTEDAAPAWFENGQVHIVNKTSGASHEITDLKNFCVYGTQFDITKHAWAFANRSWKYEKLSSDIAKAGEIIAGYLDDASKVEIWKSIGTSRKLKSEGLCYGLAHAAIADFNHGGAAWGTGGLAQWADEIDGHWSKGGTDHAVSFFKPFSVDRLNGLKWDLASAKKIMYYHVGQKNYRNATSIFASWCWVGDDGNESIPPNSPEYPLAVLRDGSPFSFGVKLTKNREKSWHKIACTQFIRFNSNDIYILWDNELPYSWQGSFILHSGPYLQWTFDSNNPTEIKPVRKIRFKDEKQGDIIFDLASFPFYMPPSGDPQNIYNMCDSAAASTSTPKPEDAAAATAEETLPNMIEVQIIGGQVTGVSIKSSGQAVTLIPNGDPDSGQATIQTTCGGSYNLLQLPVSDTYRIEATKFSDNPFLKIFVRIPQADGTVTALNYDDVSTSETAATSVYFYVGRGNTDKGVRQVSASASDATFKTLETQMEPDYDEELTTAIAPPRNFSGVYQDGGVTLQWVNPTHPELAAVKIVRSLTGYPVSHEDGTEIFDGLSETVQDSNVTRGDICYYAAFSRKTSGTYSDATYAVVNTWRYSVYGSVTANGAGVAGVELELKDESGNQVAVTTTGTDGRYHIGNLEMDPYELTAGHTGYDIANPVRNVSLSAQNMEENFTATARAAVELRFGLASVLIGQTYEVPWSYQNIANGEAVNLFLCSDGNCSPLAQNLPILNGYFEWNVQGVAVVDATLKLALSSNPDVYDEQALSVLAMPTITTTAPTDIASTTAMGGGNVISDGGGEVTARGVCWNTSANPTTANDRTFNGTGTGKFTSRLTGLEPEVTYYVRAYATNSEGTAYGVDESFQTVPAADIAIVKTVDNPKAGVGEDVTFTIVATNNGPSDATGVLVVDLLPEGLIYVEDDAEGLYDPGTGIWDIGDLANGESATLVVAATVEMRGKISNIAELTASTPLDPNWENDLDTAIIHKRIMMPWIPLLLLLEAE